MLQSARDASGEGSEPYAPPMSMWSMEADLLATLIDEVRALKHLTVAVNSPKGKQPNPPKPFPRPRTVMASARVASRAARHRALAARVLPHKYGIAAPSLGAPQSAPVTTPSPLDMPKKKGTWASR